MEKVKGIEVYSLPDDERQRWLEKGGKPIWDQWVKKMESKGNADAQKILDECGEYDAVKAGEVFLKRLIR